MLKAWLVGCFGWSRGELPIPSARIVLLAEMTLSLLGRNGDGGKAEVGKCGDELAELCNCATVTRWHSVGR